MGETRESAQAKSQEKEKKENNFHKKDFKTNTFIISDQSLTQKLGQKHAIHGMF